MFNQIDYPFSEKITLKRMWTIISMSFQLKDGYFDKLDLPVGGSPVFEDMDFDGDLDMVIGTEKGTLVYFRNTGR